MRSERDDKLAQADSRIAEAERNIRHVESLLPRLTEQGYSTVEIEGHLDLMAEALHHLKENRSVLDGARHRPRRVERRREGKHTIGADAPDGGLEAGDAAPGGRQPYRSPRIRTDRTGDHARGDRRPQRACPLWKGL